MVLDAGAGNLRSGLKSQFHAKAPWQLVLFRILCHSAIVDIAGVEVFPPNPVTALAQMPSHDAIAIFFQHIKRLQSAAFPHPVDIVTEPDNLGLRVAEIVMELSR